MWYNLKRQLNKLSKNKIIGSYIIILTMTTKEGKVKDGKKINKKEIKDGKTTEGINKIVMDNLVDLSITEMVTIEIMEVGEGI
jgi:hypothetical protein